MSDLYKPSVSELLAFVGNPDAYAEQKNDGSWHPVRAPLTRAVIRRHRAGDVTVGTYIVKPPDQARTLVFDIDAKSDSEAQVDMKAVTSVLVDLNRNGRELHWTTEFSGRKGWHIWILAEDYMPAEVLYRLGRGIREEAGLPKLEVYPKQTHLDPNRVTAKGGSALGNLVKLPGGTHRVTGNHNNVLGEVGHRVWRDELEEAAAMYPEVGVRGKGVSDGPVAYPCVHSIQEGVKEGGRNIHLFHLATMLRRWSLSDENVEDIVRRANAAGDPLDDAELETLLESSRHSGPVCGQLSDEVNCGEQCILAKHAGLYTRAGSLKWAQPGEKVVLEVGPRTDDGAVIELVHDDLMQGRVILREPGRKTDGD